MNTSLEDKRQRLQTQLDAAKTAEERNRLGQFSTPFNLATDMLAYAKRLLPRGAKVSFFDPGFGTGVFYSALLSTFPPGRIVRAEGFEIDQRYRESAIDVWNSRSFFLHQKDFTQASPPDDEFRKHNLIICNPPYIRHHHILNGEKARLQDLTEPIFGERISGLAGFYCYFLALSHLWMKENGVAGWLIPSEFMDVNYGKPVKRYLLERVTLLRVHRFDPQDVQFRDALVSSAVVWFRKTAPPSDHSVEFTFGGSLERPEISKMVPKEFLVGEPKWTRYPLGPTREGSAGATLGDFFSIRRGLATGDNNFFVMPLKRIQELGLPLNVFRPVLPSPRFLKVDEVLADKDGNPDLEPRTFLLDCRLSPDVIQKRYPRLWHYLEKGHQSGVANRFLCKHRSPWYTQEYRPSSLFVCTYMGRSATERPSPFRFILNRSKATVTNSYHLLYPRPELEARLATDPSLTRQIWHILRTIHADTMMGEGRVYGGGLHKIEPKELSRVSAHTIAHLLSRSRSLRKDQLELFSDNYTGVSAPDAKCQEASQDLA
ncbi:MAG: SAM-dependent DNA methyltransferase [Thermodesulfobacteriota bacterium]